MSKMRKRQSRVQGILWRLRRDLGYSLDAPGDRNWGHIPERKIGGQKTRRNGDYRVRRNPNLKLDETGSIPRDRTARDSRRNFDGARVQ
jgi:hypothetical protein